MPARSVLPDDLPPPTARLITAVSLFVAAINTDTDDVPLVPAGAIDELRTAMLFGHAAGCASRHEAQQLVIQEFLTRVELSLENMRTDRPARFHDILRHATQQISAQFPLVH